MKLEAYEADNGFFIDMEPETVQEATMLVRMGLNAARKPATVEVGAGGNGVMSCWITIPKRARVRSIVQ